MEKDKWQLVRHEKRKENASHWTRVKLFKSTDITSFEE